MDKHRKAVIKHETDAWVAHLRDYFEQLRRDREAEGVKPVPSWVEPLGSFAEDRPERHK
ncbi:MAG: hypothetical protein M9921_01495 [Fimbriimonadaceae bacterium]|nr:hypothetical protein [Fimbriimonadaceae bacterium]